MRKATELHQDSKTCLLCGKSLKREGFCDECEEKVKKRFPHDEWEYMDIEDIQAALDNPENEAVAPTSQKQVLTSEKTKKAPEIDSSVCACCKKKIDKKDALAADLKEGYRVCGDCVSQVRILYPKDYTWMRFLWTSEDIDKNDSEEALVWLDPLQALDKTDFISAMQAAKAERLNRQTTYSGSQACFRVDENARIIKDQGKGRRFISNDYALSGTVLLGEVKAGERITVKRREGKYSFSIKYLEVPAGNQTMAMVKADRIPEGGYGRIILGEDAACIYPGDVLTIE